jgi:uncharacterized phiE125 gp8 family phage protein
MENEIYNLIALDEVKHFLRVTTDIDNIIIKNLLKTALFQLEKYIGKTLIQQTYEQDFFDYDNNKISLIHQPIAEIISVELHDGKKINHYLENSSIILLERVQTPIKIKYVAGLFKAILPSIFKIAILQITSYLYNSDHTKYNLDTILNDFHFLKEYKL